MLQKGITALAIIVVALSAYDLLTDSNALLPVMMLCASILMLLVGVSELKKDKKNFMGYLSIAVFAVTTYVSIHLFLNF